MNSIVEATNKNIKKILPFTLCAYCTFVHTSAGATPYSLVYSMEVILPAEVEILYLRILSQTKLSEDEWAHSRYERLNMVDEKHMTTMCHG